jgi:hypothetical protein
MQRMKQSPDDRRLLKRISVLCQELGRMNPCMVAWSTDVERKRSLRANSPLES